MGDTYTDLIIDLLTKDVSPEMICTNLGLCKPGDRPVQQQVVDTVKIGAQVGGPYCTLCEIVVGDLDTMLQDKTNEEEIMQALDVLCYRLSDPVHKECEKLVSKYTEELVYMIVHDYPPHMMCAELGLCVDHEISSNDIFQVEFEPVQVVVDSRRDSLEVACEMCEFAMSIIDERLEDTSTIDQIEREIQFVCSFLPSSIGDKCEELVDKYGEQLVDAIVKEDLDPKKVCSEVLPACSDGPSHPCVWGPALWCATPFHAKVCGTTQFCQDTVWRQPTP